MKFYYITICGLQELATKYSKERTIEAWSNSLLDCCLFLRPMYDLSGDTYCIASMDCVDFNDFKLKCIHNGIIDPIRAWNLDELELISSSCRVDKHGGGYTEGYYVFTREDQKNIEIDLDLLKDAVTADFFNPLKRLNDLAFVFNDNIREDFILNITKALDYFARLYTLILNEREEIRFPMGQSYANKDSVVNEFTLAGLMSMLYYGEIDWMPTTIDMLKDDDFQKGIIYKQEDTNIL